MIGEMHSYLPFFFQDLVGKKKKKKISKINPWEEESRKICGSPKFMDD